MAIKFMFLITILSTFLILLLAQKSPISARGHDSDLWPQNYPGHLPTNISIPPAGADLSLKGVEEVNYDDDDDEEDYDDELWPQNYPGHVPTNITGNANKSESMNNAGDHQDGSYHSPWEHRRENDEHRNHRSWWDWLFPWRWWRHGGGGRRGKDRNQTRGYEDEEEEDDGRNRTADDGRNETEHVRIRISGGQIRGFVSRAAGPGKPALVFKGVPMAEPPMGKLRFRPLQKKRRWHQELDATKYSPACLSNTTRTRSPQKYISEDCIYMNVFTDPKCLHDKPCPVLFYIHGGGFVYDSATMFNDTQIVQKYASDGIVFMIPAYRLGVFGFLDLGNDRTVKRNLGMHDIIFALKWAKREAQAFGGDPGRITVMGNSAGGSAVMYLCASPAVKQDQFQQAIISSGVPFFTNNTNLMPSRALLERFNCTHSNRSGIPYSDREKTECLRGVDSLELLRGQEQVEEMDKLLFAGPETDSELLPARNYAEMFKYWKPVPMLKMTTKWEFLANWGDNPSLATQCTNNCILFGYSPAGAAFRKCMDRYEPTFDAEMMVTTKNEFEGPSNTKAFTDKNAKLGKECYKEMVPFGYQSRQAFEACVTEYNSTFYTERPGLDISFRQARKTISGQIKFRALMQTNRVLVFFTLKAHPMMLMNMKREFDPFVGNSTFRLLKECHRGLVPFGYFSQARPLLVMTTANEEWWDENETLSYQCNLATVPFGYTSPQSFDACLARYNATFTTEINMRVSYESMHSEAFLTALVNTRNGGRSYVGEFELKNYSNHANDMYFFIGLHPITTNGTDVKLMDAYYPRMMKNFIRGKAPDPEWKPQNWNGRNYFRIAYNFTDNGTLIEWPHNVDGYQDLVGLDFWLREMAEVERNASKEAEKAGGKAEDTWQYVFGPKAATEHENELEKAEDLGDDAGGFRFPILATMPRHMEMLGTPLDEQLLEQTTGATMGTQQTSPSSTLAPIVNAAEEGTTGTQEKASSPSSTFSPIVIPTGEEGVTPSIGPLEQNVASGYESPATETTERVGRELHNVWSAFWLTLTVAVLLAIVVVMMTATKMIHRHQNSHGHQHGGRGYSYSNGRAGGANPADFFRFTEKSRILAAPNDANSARYYQ